MFWEQNRLGFLGDHCSEQVPELKIKTKKRQWNRLRECFQKLVGSGRVFPISMTHLIRVDMWSVQVDVLFVSLGLKKANCGCFSKVPKCVVQSKRLENDGFSHQEYSLQFPSFCSLQWLQCCIQAGLGKISKKTAALYDTRENDSDDEFFDRAAWEPGMWTWQMWQKQQINRT